MSEKAKYPLAIYFEAEEGDAKHDCRECGACCEGPIPMMRDDIKRFTAIERARYVKRLKEPMKGLPEVRGLMGADDEPCPALSMTDGSASCLVYLRRPHVCQKTEVGSLACESARDGYPSWAI